MIMKLFKLLLLNFVIFQSSCQLIRPIEIYKNIIKDIHGYENNGCILLVHGMPDFEITEDANMGTKLKNLQEYFSILGIYTVIMSINTLALRINDFYNIKKPLFVFLNDFDDLKERFATLIVSRINIAYPSWLMFFRDHTTIENFFVDIYIPFDCKFMVSKRFMGLQDREIITEVYQIEQGKQLRQGIFATWDVKTGTHLPRLTLYQRRNNLYGHPLRVISVDDPPASEIIRNNDNGVTGLSGFFGGLMDLLQETMNFTIIYQTADEWGELTDNGTWTGAIGSVINKTSDIFAAELLMTQQRLDVLQFTTPIYSTKCRTYIKKPESSLLWNKFIMPFTSGIWSTVGVMSALTTFSLLAIKHLRRMISNNIEVDEISHTSGVHIFFDIIGSLCGQGIPMSVLDSIRFVHFVIHLTGVVVLAAYSAALISSLAVQVFIIPFTSIEGLLKDKSYRFGMVQSDYNFFQNTSDKIMNHLFNEILTKEDELPKNYFMGLNNVCKETKYAFLALDTAVSQLKQSINCKLIPLDPIAEISVGLALRPDSPFRGIINNKILLMRDSGILRKLLYSLWTFPGDEKESLWQVVEITDIFSLLTVIGGTSFLSLVILFVEKIYTILQQRSKNKKRGIKLNRLFHTRANRLPMSLHNNLFY